MKHCLACLASSSLVALMLAGTALGQQEAKDPALQGPKVTDRNVPGAAPDFGMGANGRRFAERIPPEVFRRAMGVIMAEDAPAELRASEELRATLRSNLEQFEEKARKFRREHAKDLEELRKAAGETGPRRPGAAPADEPMQGMSEEEQKARESARAKLRELQASAPKIEDVYTQVWTHLSEAQRTAVQAKLDEWRDQQTKQREDEYVRRLARQKDAAGKVPEKVPASVEDPAKAPAKAAPGEKPPRPNADGNARRERLLRFFNQLTPEEQEQLLQRLESRMAERRQQRREGERGKVEKKAAPDVERVKVPSPEGDR